MAAYAFIASLTSRIVGAGLLLAGIGSGVSGLAHAEMREGDRVARHSVQETIPLAELPRQGQQVYRAIFQGGPFRHDKDGTVFGNRERLLPFERRGHYREYTVETPDISHRGARRIVCGGEQKTVPSTCWYTANHYASFRRILP